MIGVLGGGAFGSALAIALARTGNPVQLWTRRLASPCERLPGIELPPNLRLITDLQEMGQCEVTLLALPMQSLGAFLADHRGMFDRKRLVLCCKGIDLATGEGPSGVVSRTCAGARIAVLTGPSFAADIAAGLPTALTLAAEDEEFGREAQVALSTSTLRIYRSNDVIGAEMGGALKNVVAIAAGVVIGAGLGHSARAALMTRGYAEMVRLATAFEARAETLAGLSGLGDLVLTCTSEQSRNFQYGRALGAGGSFDPGVTVEGVATARGAVRLAAERGVDMPVAGMVAALVEGRVAVQDAVAALMSRPLKEE